MKVDDFKRDLKTRLIDILSSRASQEDLDQVKFDKTNKDDTDQIMKCMDIMHKQMIQISTMIMELIKQGITTKILNDTEKEQRQKFLLVQQGNLIKWITEFDP